MQAFESESEVAQLWLFATPWTVSPPGSSVHGILQARILEWVAISFSRGSFQPRDRIQVSDIVGRCFIVWATREACRQILCFLFKPFFGQAHYFYFFHLPSRWFLHHSGHFHLNFFKQKSRAQLCGHIKWHGLLPLENMARRLKEKRKKLYIYIKGKDLENKFSGK